MFVKAKFHYAIQVADLVADPLALASSLLASRIVRDRPNSSSLQVCDLVAGQVCDLNSIMECCVALSE